VRWEGRTGGIFGVTEDGVVAPVEDAGVELVVELVVDGVVVVTGRFVAMSLGAASLRGRFAVVGCSSGAIADEGTDEMLLALA
jgi:hypothetical protein